LQVTGMLRIPDATQEAILLVVLHLMQGITKRLCTIYDHNSEKVLLLETFFATSTAVVPLLNLLSPFRARRLGFYYLFLQAA